MTCLAAAVVVVAATLRRRRFRLLANPARRLTVPRGRASGLVGLMAERAGFPHPSGIGISSGAAVSAVLTYRLATYWLPILPGWYSWRLLQRMDYVQPPSLRAGTVGQDQFGRGLDGEPERRATRDVEREMGSDVDTGQPDQRDDAQRESTASRAQPGKSGGT